MKMSPRIFASLVSRFAMTAIFACLAVVHDATAQSASGLNRQCEGGYVGRRSYSYCIERDNQSKSRGIVYYFHGNGESEQSWGADRHKAIRANWAKMGIDAPVVISVSFGKTWFLDDHSRRDFIMSVMPAIEERANLTNPESRALIGESMGGFNATSIAEERSSGFSRVAIACPALLPVEPYAAESTLADFIESERPHINEKIFRKWISKLQNAFPSLSLWQTNSPLGERSRSLDNKGPALWVSANGADEFGFFKGAEKLIQVARSQDASIRYIPLPDTSHCQQSPESLEDLAKFLGER